MLEFIYESIETLKEVKKPTKQEVIKMTVAVLVIVSIAAVVFSVIDYLFLHLQEDILYNFFTSLFK